MGSFDGDILEPDYKSYNKGGTKQYRKFLNKQFGKGGRDVGQIYRSTAYDTLGENQRNADIGLGESLTQSLGFNNSSGVGAALQRRSAMESDYAGAAVASKEAARRTKLQMGQALQSNKQAQVNHYTGIASPYLQENGMLSQMAAAEGAAEGQEEANTLSSIGSLIGILAML